MLTNIKLWSLEIKHITFILKENLIECEDEAKLLGVTIDYQLTFNTHIDNMCEKAAKCS